MLIKSVKGRICILTMLGDIQSKSLFLLIYAEWSEDTDDPNADQSTDNCNSRSDDNA